MQGIHLPHLQAEAAGAARQGEDQYFLSQMRDELYQKDITKGPSAEGSFFDGWDEKAPGGIGGIGSGGLMLLHHFTRWGQSSCFLVSFLAPRQRAPTTARPIAM